MITKICLQCNQSFVAADKSAKFCSKRCLGLSLSKKVLLVCPVCKKSLYVHKGTKHCSKKCADIARIGVPLSPSEIRTCPVCNKQFEVKVVSPKIFCSRNCSQQGKRKSRPRPLTDEERLARSNQLKMQWKDPKFRQIVIDRMTNNNPVYRPGVVEKAAATRNRNNHSFSNNFKYGNGKISPYEQLVMNKLEPLGFIYNYAVPTRSAREAYPDAHYPNNYKPDFTHLTDKLCIEIDGAGHSTVEEKSIDVKKETCLNFLGYQVIRFTHADIDNGVFDQWLNSYQKNI